MPARMVFSLVTIMVLRLKSEFSRATAQESVTPAKSLSLWTTPGTYQQNN